MKHLFAAFVLALSTSGVAAGAQSPGFGVSVVPTITARRGDTVTVSYAVRVEGNARDSLATFMVDAPGLVTVDLPGPRDAWWIGSRYHERSVATWAKLGGLPRAGSVLPPLKYTAVGLPGVVQYWAEVDLPLDSVITEEPPDTTNAPDTTVHIKGVHGWTLGVVALPADRSDKAMVARLSTLIDRLCDLGWIDHRPVCDDFHPRARAQKAILLAFIVELNAQRGKHCNDAAYWILAENVRYLLGRM